MCAKTKLICYEPLWDDTSEELLREFFENQFKAKIIAVKADCLSKDYLGKILTEEFIHEFIQKGIDLCGENGEYHTVVIDAPIFSKPIELIEKQTVFRGGYWFLDVYV